MVAMMVQPRAWLFPRHDHHRGGAVADHRSVAGRGHAAFFESRAHFGQLLS
jgi:hypothetical protein